MIYCKAMHRWIKWNESKIITIQNYLATEHIRVDVALAVLEQTSFLTELATTANRITTRVMIRFVVLLELIIVFPHKLTLFAYKRTKLSNKLILFSNFLRRFQCFPGNGRVCWTFFGWIFRQTVFWTWNSEVLWDRLTARICCIYGFSWHGRRRRNLQMVCPYMSIKRSNRVETESGKKSSVFSPRTNFFQEPYYLLHLSQYIFKLSTFWCQFLWPDNCHSLAKALSHWSHLKIFSPSSLWHMTLCSCRPSSSLKVLEQSHCSHLICASSRSCGLDSCLRKCSHKTDFFWKVRSQQVT